ncbi:MAG: hypothetical protein KF691_13230 [Phycisphaeraceae bacterium]|nr:hypothetical protein [Phycisphaeraceae bacterium]
MSATKTRSVLALKRNLFAAPIAALLALSGQALAKVPAALDRVPKNAMLVIATDNFEQTTNRIKNYADKLRIEDTEDFDDFVKQLSETKGFKKDGSLALVVMAPPTEAPKEVKKEDDNDDMDHDHRDHDDPMERAVVLAQTTDYKQLVTELGGDASAKVASVEGMGDMPMYVRDAGDGWVIIGPVEETVSSFQPAEHALKQHEEALGVVGNRAAQASDLILIANWETIAPQFSKQIDRAVADAKKGGKRRNPMFGPIPPETMAQFIAPIEDIARAYNRDAQTCVAGIGLGEDGLTFDIGAQFKPKSQIAGFFQSTGKADTTLVSLPQTPFLFAVSADTTSPGTRQIAHNASDIAEKMLTVAKDEAKRQAAEGDKAASKQADMVIKMIEGQTAGIRDLAKSIDKIDGVDFVWGYSPAMLAGAGLFSGVIYQARGSDPAALKGLFVDRIKATQEMDGPMKMEASVTANAAEVNGVKLDTWALKPKMDPNDPMASQMAMVNMFIFGATGQMSGNIATTKNSAIVTFSPNTQIMQSALDAASGKNTMAENKGVATAVKGLPEGSMARGLIGTKSIFDLAQMAMSFAGMPIQLKVPADVPPMAVGVTGDGGGMHIRFHAPMQVVNTIGDVLQQVRESQQHQGGGDDDSNEKPRF